MIIRAFRVAFPAACDARIHMFISSALSFSGYRFPDSLELHLQLDDADAIKKKEQELQSDISSKKEVLRKIQAPNMRALDK